MAVVGNAEEVLHTSPGSETEEGIRYTRRWKVNVSSALDGPQAVLGAPGLPAMFQAYQTTTEQNLSAWVVSRTPTRSAESRKLWFVDVEYDSGSEAAQAGSENPVNEFPEITVDFEQYKEPIPGEMDQAISPGEVDSGVIAWKSGIRNSAGEAYFPFPERECARPVITYRRNEPQFNLYNANQFINSVNAQSWSGLGVRQALLRGVRAHSKTLTVGNNTYLFYDVEYTFVLKRETWDMWLLDYGHYYLSYPVGGGAPTRKQFKTEGTGEPRLGLLDHGNEAQPGKRFAQEQTATPQYNRYRVYKEQNFSQLNISLNLTIEQLRRPKQYVR